VSQAHTNWCAEGHRCGGGEHRTDPINAWVGNNHLVVTRVLTRGGRQYAEIVASVELPDHEGYAKLAFARVLDRFVGVLGGWSSGR
jgi:hypothetical protein